MFENPRRGRQARNFTTNDPKMVDLKSSSKQIFSESWRRVPLIASSVQKVSYSKPLHNKSGCLNTMKSSLTFKVISTWVFLYFQKVLTMKIWQNTQFTTAILFCFIFTAWRGEYLTVIPRAWMGPNGKGNFLREKYFNFVEISSFRENKETKKVVFTSRLYQCKM